MTTRIRLATMLLFSVMTCLAFIGVTQGQTLSGSALVAALRQGGYVIVMRHASSPREVPDKTIANSDNTKPERQLDEAFIFPAR